MSEAQLNAQKICLKCCHVNSRPTGDPMEACPGCGAIYSRMEAAQEAKTTAQANAPSNLERVRTAKAAEKQNKRLMWQYGIIFVCLVLAVPMWIYHEFWGAYAQQRKSEARSNAARAAQADSTPVVSNSAWDGSVRQVQQYLKAHLKDPSSLEVIEWSPVASGPGNDFTVRVKYRAKNSIGGYAIEQKVFRLNASGAVTGVSDL